MKLRFCVFLHMNYIKDLTKALDWRQYVSCDNGIIFTSYKFLVSFCMKRKIYIFLVSNIVSVISSNEHILKVSGNRLQSRSKRMYIESF